MYQIVLHRLFNTHQARNQLASNLNRIFPLRLDFKERSIACLNWSRG